MKKIVSLLSVAIMLMTAGVASAAEFTVYYGTFYDIVIDPMPELDVGLTNPGGEDLVGFMLKIRNISGNERLNPAGFDGVTHGRFGIYTEEPDGKGFHHQHFTSTPTLDEEMAGNVTATLIDTHFNFLASEIKIDTPATETNNVAPSVEPLDATGPFAYAATVAFGDRLYGDLALTGGAEADIDGDGDPATWMLAWIVVPLDTTVYMNFFTTGIDPGEEIVGSFTVPIPEPATMSLLALGGIGALIRRRK